MFGRSFNTRSGHMGHNSNWQGRMSQHGSLPSPVRYSTQTNLCVREWNSFHKRTIHICILEFFYLTHQNMGHCLVSNFVPTFYHFYKNSTWKVPKFIVLRTTINISCLFCCYSLMRIILSFCRFYESLELIRGS